MINVRSHMKLPVRPNPNPLRQVTLKNLLSFGPEPRTLDLKSLNILIGPNAAGKSNLIEALALMRATPIPAASSSSDVRAIIRRSGGVSEWVWKGAPGNSASLDLVVSHPKGKKSQLLRHAFSFRAEKRFVLHDERVEDQYPDLAHAEPYFYYRFQDGKPAINSVAGKKRNLNRETIDIELSILAQRRDPEQYPEISHLADIYEKMRIYREWSFGRNTVFREPQRADMRNDRLEEDFSNLGMFLSRLQKTPRAKAAILSGLQDLYEGVTDFNLIVEGGTVQVFFTEGEFSVPATRLSDGTLRYLCLLAILCDPDPPPLICIEEPELGLHPDILPKLSDLMIRASENTQLIVTTHSDVIVDAMSDEPEAVVVCEKHEGMTTMTRLVQADLLEWLKKYRLGQLWSRGQIGGNRW